MTRLLCGSVLVIALWAPAVATAQTQEEVIYFHTDAVGSVRMVTDANGQVIARYDYLPFGETWPADPSLPETRQFTGQERDANTGFDYFSARYYASANGRFTTPDDPAYIDPFDPQSTNRYAYTYNNPLRYNDPAGHAPDCPDQYYDSKTGKCNPPAQDPFPLDDFFFDRLFRNPILGAQVRGFGEGVKDTVSALFSSSGPPSCFGIAMKTAFNELNPISPGISDIGEMAVAYTRPQNSMKRCDMLVRGQAVDIKRHS
jgi:RHS repeat-associated protein